MDIDLGPLGVLFCWQSCVLAFGITTMTHGVKRVVDFTVGGKEERKKRMLFNSIILPATPIVLGLVIGILVPLHPEELIKYMADHSIVGGKKLAVLGAYGMCLGQFADYIWGRYSSLLDGVKGKKKRKTEEAPAPAPEPAPEAPKEGP